MTKKVSKMSAAQAGRIGGVNSAISGKVRLNERIIKYNIKPKRCAGCNQALPYENRKQLFCGHSCRATHYNLANSKKITWACAGCGKLKTTLPHKKKTYCGNKCQGTRITEDMLVKFNQGFVKNRPTIKRLLVHLHGHSCFNCKLTDWQGVKIPLEVHHVGDVANNLPSNLQLLCPNCHALTPNWKGKNKGNGRAAKGLPTN